jgi:hypothetical protein
MIENYKMIEPGHWFQIEKTGEQMQYNSQYMNYYTKMDESMSALRTELLSKYVSFESVCDFGYGDGKFLNYVRKYKGDTVKCYGHDISNFPLDDGIEFVADMKDADVDVVTFFDSIEHIHDANIHEFLGSIKTKNVMISLPWMHERMGPEWFRTWKHRKENEHYHHFDAYGLIQLVHKAGFTPIHISNDEDKIRKSVSYLPNILTIIAKKNYE